MSNILTMYQSSLFFILFDLKTIGRRLGWTVVLVHGCG